MNKRRVTQFGLFSAACFVWYQWYKTKNVQETTSKSCTKYKRSDSAQRIHIIQLSHLNNDQLPKECCIDYYFKNLDKCDHKQLFDSCKHVFEILESIHNYSVEWLNQTLIRNCQTKVYISQNLQNHNNGSTVTSNNNDVSVISTSKTNDISSITVYFHHKNYTNPQNNKNISSQFVQQFIFHPEKLISISLAKNSDADTSANATSNMAKYCIMVGLNCQILGGVFNASKGSIYIGDNVTIQSNVYIEGPTIIGNGCEIRFGAYIRGNVILGNNVTIRSELKNVVILDGAELCHPGYCGDSICGYHSHFGNQVTTANLPFNINKNNRKSKKTIAIKVNDKWYDSERRKIGVILGDYSEIGCSSVTDPGTLIGRNCIVYPLTRLKKGIYKSNTIIKNKPMEMGIVQCVERRLL